MEIRKFICDKCNKEIREEMHYHITLGHVTWDEGIDLCRKCFGIWSNMEDLHTEAWKEIVREFYPEIRKIEESYLENGNDLWKQFAHRM